MPDLGKAILTLAVEKAKFVKDLRGAKKSTDEFAAKGEKSTGRLGKGFSALRGKIVEASGQIPVFGGLISKVLGAATAGPLGLATAGFAAMGAAIAGSVTKVAAMERELRPMIERSGIAGEKLQILAEAAKRAGSEDGLDGVTDSSQELQLRLAEVVQDGTGPAAAAFEKLGLSAQDLIDKSPEESFLATVDALQKVTNEADRKFLADELMGGSSEKLSGIINLTSEEFAALTENVAATADILSDDGIESAREFNDMMGELKGVAGGLMTDLGEMFIPIILDLVEAFKEIWPVIEPLVRIVGGNLKLAFEALASVLKIAAAVLRGDFAGAWREIKLLVLNVVESIVANVEALIDFMPDKFVPDSWEQGVKQARATIQAEMERIEAETETASAGAADAVETSGRRIADSAGATATAVADASSQQIRSWTAEQEEAKIRAAERAKYEAEVTKSIAEQGAARLAKAREIFAANRKRQEEEIAAQKEYYAKLKAENAAYLADKLEADREAAGVTQVEYALALAKLRGMTAEHHAAMFADMEDASEQELAIMLAKQDKIEREQTLAWNAEKRRLAEHLDDLYEAVRTADDDERANLSDQIAELVRIQAAANRAETQAQKEQLAALFDQYLQADREQQQQLTIQIEELTRQQRAADEAERQALTEQLQATADAQALADEEERLAHGENISLIQQAQQVADDAELTTLGDLLTALEVKRTTADDAEKAQLDAHIRHVQAAIAADHAGRNSLLASYYAGALSGQESHSSAMVAANEAMAAGINAALDAIETPKYIDVITRRTTITVGGGGGGGGSGGGSGGGGGGSGGGSGGGGGGGSGGGGGGPSGDPGSGAGDPAPTFATGGVVLPRPGGIHVNVAEAGQAEAIIPLDRFFRNMATEPAQVGDGEVHIHLELGAQEFEDVWVGTAADLFLQGRINQDLGG